MISSGIWFMKSAENSEQPLKTEESHLISSTTIFSQLEIIWVRKDLDLKSFWNSKMQACSDDAIIIYILCIHIDIFSLAIHFE